jgi:hypothetical protein
MNNKELLYKKLNALRLEVDSSIVDDIKSTVDALFQEQNLQQANVSLSLPPYDGELLKKLWMERNPQHGANCDTGEDMFWRTVFMVMADYMQLAGRQ